MGSFIARLKSCKAIRITFCWQNNFSQRQGTLLLVVLQFPPCLWLSVLPHLCSQTAKLLSWLYFNIHMLGESKSNRFLSILTASLRSSVPAAPCFLFLFSIIPSCYVSASLAHSAAVRALSKWAPLHLEKLGERKKKEMLCANYSLLQNGKMASLKPTSDPQKSLFPSTLLTPKRVHASVDKKNCTHI